MEARIGGVLPAVLGGPCLKEDGLGLCKGGWVGTELSPYSISVLYNFTHSNRYDQQHDTEPGHVAL